MELLLPIRTITTRFFNLAMLTVLIFAHRPVQAAVPQATSSPTELPVVEPLVLCLPGIYLENPGDCQPIGPSGYLTAMAEQGMTLPLPPLPAKPIDPELSQVDMRYGEVITQNAPVYGSVEDAKKHKKRKAIKRLSGDFVYISYSQMLEEDGKRLYMIAPNAWMTAADVSRIGVLPRQQGLVFSHTPSTDFGWVITYWISEPLQTKRTPGDEYPDYTGHILNLYDLVHIFAQEQVEEETWYLIGPEEWVPQKYIARVSPDPAPPEGISGERWMEINLDEQTLLVYDQDELVFATIIASGSDPFWTRPGLFQINDKLESTPMTGSFEADRSDAYYLEDVPWTMYFDAARALHGAYWRAKMGFPQSHGCVNLTVGDAHWIFNWADVGDWVYVWDPSGETPTDPDLYGSGGF